MSIVRLLSAIVLAAGLALAPVGAALAVTHAAGAGMGAVDTSADDCPCCKSEPSKSGPLCCHVPALLVAELTVAVPGVESHSDGGTTALVSFLTRPEPPPPRS